MSALFAMKMTRWLLLLTLLTPGLAESASSDDEGRMFMEVRSGRELAVAFASSARIDVALVLADVWMTEADWHGLLNGSEPVLLSKNFTVLGSPSLPDWPLLHMGFVRGKIRIGNGVTLTVRHVVVSDFRSDLLTQAPGFDLATNTSAAGPPGVLLHNETAVTYSVCLPKPIWSQGISSSSRATSRPGTQLFQLGQRQGPDCANLTATSQPGTATTTTATQSLRYPPRAGLALQPRLPARCWADRGVFLDMAVPGADLTDRGRSTVPNNYDVVLLNVSYMCASVIPPDCSPSLLACALLLTRNGTVERPWQLPVGPGAEVAVRTGRELAVALAAAPLVASVLVVRDIWMREADWEGLLGGPNGSEPVLLSRSLTIAGAPGLASWPLLNLGFVHDKIRIASDVTLTAHHALIGDYRNEIPTQGPGFDLAAITLTNAYDTGPGLLVHNETALLYALCFPAPLWSSTIVSAPRATSRPGNQTFLMSTSQFGCVDVNAAAAASSSSSSESTSSGLLQPPLMSRCWADRGLFIDLGLRGADVDAYDKQVPTSYDILLLNVTYLCANVMTTQCLEVHGGATGCTNWMRKQLAATAAGVLPWRELPTSPSAAALAAPSPGGGADGGTVRGAAIGGAIGGAVLLAALAAAVLLLVRRRRRRLFAQKHQKQGGGDGLHFSSIPDKAGSRDAAAAASPPLDGAAASLDPWKPGSSPGSNPCLPLVFFQSGAASSGAAAAPASFTKGATGREATAGSAEAVTASDSVAAGDGGDGPGSGSASASASGTGTGGRVKSREGGSAGPAALGAPAGAAAAAAAAERECGSGGGEGSGGAYLGQTGIAGGAGGLHAPVSSDGPGPRGDPLAPSSGDPSTGISTLRPPRPQPSTAGLQPEDEHVVVTPLTPPRADLALGEAAAQEVTLLPVVRGKGAFGRVYEGMYGGEKVAVKVMRDVCDLDAGGGGSLEHVRNSFAQEVEVLGRCCHPNVVRLLAACLTPPKLLLVMELMETSLEKLVYNKAAGLLPLRTALYIALDIAKGLEYLHPTILHRDLKPGNVLINGANTPRPLAKLTDFGVSRLRSTVLITKHPEAGTPAYMAPETFDVKNYTLTHQVDIYSYGVLLWVLLTGEHPWRGFQMVEVAYKVTINRERLPTSRIPPARCHPRLRALMEQCWEYEPRRRPAAAEIVKELQSLLDSLPL